MNRQFEDGLPEKPDGRVFAEWSEAKKFVRNVNSLDCLVRNPLFQLGLGGFDEGEHVFQ